jgi:hypothetical protein
MRSFKIQKNLRLLSFLALLLSFSFVGCDSDDESKTNTMIAGEMTAGEITAGEVTAGEVTAGEVTAGEMTAGEMTAGEMTAGEMTAGEMTAGEMTAGEMTAGTEGPICRGGQNYGYTENFTTLGLSGTAPFTAPQLVELSDGGWIIAWLSSMDDTSNEINFLKIQRLDQAMQPVGDPTLIARAKGGQYQLHATSTGVVLVWINQRSNILTNEGVYIQAFDTMAMAVNMPLSVNQSFNVRSIDSAWADGFGGILVMSEPQKLSALTFNQMGLASAPEVLSEVDVRSPSVTFTGSGWSIAWLSRNVPENPYYDISIVSLNDQGSLLTEVRTITEIKATGKVDLAYGNGIYSLVWSFPDPTSLDPNPRQIIGMRLLDETLNEIGRFFVMDGTTDLSLHQVAWIPPSLFAVSWSQSPLGGSESILGIGRINQLGQVLPSIIVSDEGVLYTELNISGNASAMRTVFTADMNPQPTGLFSTDTVIMTAPIEPCEE